MKNSLFFLALTISFSVAAQTESDIRKHYAEVNKQIQESVEHGFEGPLIVNQWINNKNGKSWPAVGLYEETTDFWYDDPPYHVDASERNPKAVLLKINVKRKSSHLIVNEEYLFRDGKLLFYYNHEGEEGNEWETRVYYNAKGVMFKNSVKANGKELTAKDFLTEDYKDFKPNAVKILNTAKIYQDLFVKSMM